VSAPQAVATRVEAPSWRLIATLGIAGAAAGLLLVFVFNATQPRIEAYKEKMLSLAIAEVLGDPHRVETFFLLDGELASELPPGVDARRTERVFLGSDREGGRIGYAILAAQPGFQDVIKLIFGYDPDESRVLGMKVLESKETPGLGDKIEKDLSFVEQFGGASAPLVGVKPGQGDGGADQIDMITGATISSRAVIKIINEGIARWSPLLRAQAAEEGR